MNTSSCNGRAPRPARSGARPGAHGARAWVAFALLALIAAHPAGAVSIPAGEVAADDRDDFDTGLLDERPSAAAVLSDAGAVERVAPRTDGAPREADITAAATATPARGEPAASDTRADIGDDMEVDAFPPEIALTSSRARVPSALGLLRSLITLRGDTPAGRNVGRARPIRRPAEGDSLVAMLEPLALDLLEQSLSQNRVDEGRVVFSVLGHGAFVLEAARDGSGVVLSELNTGARLQAGEPSWRRGERAPWAGAPLMVDDDAGFSASPSGDAPELERAFSFLMGILRGIFGAIDTMAASPLLFLLLAPALLVAILVAGAMRRAAVRG